VGSSSQQQLLKVLLQVSKVPVAPAQPRVQDLKGTSAVLTWDTTSLDTSNSGSGRAYRLEWCQLATGRWNTTKSGLTISQGHAQVDNLTQGETYSFRLISYAVADSGGGPDSEPSLPSAPLTVPLMDPALTPGGGAFLSLQKRVSQGQQAAHHHDPTLHTNFEQQYIELEELGRGRFSVVRRCQEILTGQEVAVKFVNRRRRTRDQTRGEHSILARLRHSNIATAAGLFVTPSSDAIVMDLVSGFPLVDWLCDSPSYSESSICGYTVQLLSALSYIHTSNIVHLDIRPDNLLLESDNRTLKLIDFGEAEVIPQGSQHLAQAQLSRLEPVASDGSRKDLEFLAPEVVAGDKVGTYTDMWSFGVLLFVLLSGMSPFLDDSPEETLSNILQADLHFPEDVHCSQAGQQLVSRLLVRATAERATATACLTSAWLKSSPANLISSRHLSHFNSRRRRTSLHPLPPPSKMNR